MRYIIVVVCILVLLLFSFINNSWIRKHRGQGDKAARVYAIVKGRNRNFWAFHYAPVIIALLAACLATGLNSGWKHSAACLAGAAAVFVPVWLSSEAYAGGITATFSSAVSGNIREAVRTGYRTGVLQGMLVIGTGLSFLLALFYTAKASEVMNYIPAFILGAAVVSGILHTGGEVYSAAYSLAASSRDFTDMSGIYAGRGTDYAGSYIVSLCAAVLLSDVAVDTSGVTSTFTSSAAAFFPLLVYAGGAAGTVIGAFMQRPGVGNDPSRGSSIGCIVSGIITSAVSIYFSIDMLQSRVYAWAVIAGVAAGLVIPEISRIFSSDSKLYMNSYKADRSLGSHSSVVFNLGTGMMAVSVYVVIIIAGTAVSYMFASYYGVALFAVGFSSIAGSAAALSGLSSAAGNASEAINSTEDNADNNEMISIVTSALDKIAVRNSVYSRAYSAGAGASAAFASFCALYYLAGTITVDIMTLRVFFGVLMGIAAAFFFAGILIASVKVTGRIALRDLGRIDDETGVAGALRATLVPVLAILIPVVIGLFAGTLALAGFIIAVSAVGSIIVLMLGSSGMHYENTSVQSLTSLIRMMCAVSIAFITAFMQIGGFLFR